MQHSYLPSAGALAFAKKLATSIMFLSLIALSVPQGAFAQEATDTIQTDAQVPAPILCSDLGLQGTYPDCVPPQPEPSCTIVSDTSTLQNNQPSVLVSPIHSAWTALLNGASWIWGENPIADAANQTSETFTKTFTLSNAASTASITVAADNAYTLSVNGHLINADPGEFNYTAAGQDTIPVPGSYLLGGTNTVTATVTNFAQDGGTMASNPAGLLFTLTVNGATCTTPPPPPAPITVQASKVVCTDEKDLPNWGTGGHAITPSTARDYVAAHPGCHLQQGWSFEWGNQNTGDAGDSLIGPAGAGYTTFGPTGEDGTITTQIPSAGLTEVHLREVLQEGYVPFTFNAHSDNSDAVSAEFYCADDALNYDNWDFIRNPQAGNTYNCVAFNAPVKSEIPTKLKVHIFKYLSTNTGETTSEAQVPNESNAPQFPMIATYSIAGVATNLDPGDSYVLGNGGGAGGSDGGLTYAANTIPLSAGDTYGTHEVTGGDSVVVANQEACTVGKYYLKGYRVGASLEDAQDASLTSTAPQFPSIAHDEYVIVVNAACPGSTPPPPPTHTDETIIVHASDLAQDFGSALSDAVWEFYNDTNDTVDSAIGSFVTGPGTPVLGTGSAEFTLGASPANRKDVATFQFSGTPLAHLTSLGFSAYSHSGVAGANESPYLVFNVDFTGASNAFQGRLVYVPANNQASVPQNVWNTFDTIDGGAGNWVYSGANWPVTGEPGTTMKTWSQILATYPSARILPAGGLLGIRVGEPGPDSYTGDVDNIVVGIQTGTNIDTKTYDFEPDTITPENPVTPPGGGGGGTAGKSGSSINTFRAFGQVLGAATTTEAGCVPILSSYLRIGKKNPAGQVKILQNFLNGELSLNLPLSGFFGPMTEKGVEAFQTKYFADVLAPWVPHGLANDHAVTGYVYKTTLRKINLVACSTLNIPQPQLP